MKRHIANMWPLLFFLLVWALWRDPHSASAQTTHLHSYPALTMTGSKQQLSATGTCVVVQLYAPSGNAALIQTGDATITNSIGVNLVAGAARSIPAVVTSPLATVALSTIYVLGTSGDTLQFDCWN